MYRYKANNLSSLSDSSNDDLYDNDYDNAKEVLLPNFEYLRYYGVIVSTVAIKYEIKPHVVEALLYLYSVKLFTNKKYLNEYRKFAERSPVLSYLVQRNFVTVYKQAQRNKQHTFALTLKAKNIVRLTYAMIAGVRTINASEIRFAFKTSKQRDIEFLQSINSFLSDKQMYHNNNTFEDEEIIQIGKPRTWKVKKAPIKGANPKLIKMIKKFTPTQQ